MSPLLFTHLSYQRCMKLRLIKKSLFFFYAVIFWKAVIPNELFTMKSIYKLGNRSDDKNIRNALCTFLNLFFQYVDIENS